MDEKPMALSRRDLGKAFAGLGLLSGAGVGASCLMAGESKSEVLGYGPLLRDPARLIDLPQGFSYRIISRLGNIMDDGLPVPDRADGMGAFDAGDGKVLLVRNHELKAKDDSPSALLPPEKAAALVGYDRHAKGQMLPGGTSTMLYNPATGAVEAEWMSLLGTIRNCAGGVTPWGSWLSCEEDVTRAGDTVGRDHGYIFEVPASHRGLVDPVPLKAMGRFNHEAAAVDAKSGIVYLTEDRDDGLFYRFIPNTPGKLADGGRLQAAALTIADSRNWNGAAMAQGQWASVRWIDLDNVESPLDDLRLRGAKAGATLFARGEGVFFGTDAKGLSEIYFTCTSGGAAQMGQIFRYVPDREAAKSAPSKSMQLFYESRSADHYFYGDNLCLMPNGDLMVCEDSYEVISRNHLRGVTPSGRAYAFARVHVQSETAGACFSPDGQTMFVNIYSPTMTLAITGPWDKRIDAA